MLRALRNQGGGQIGRAASLNDTQSPQLIKKLVGPAGFEPATTPL